jgi:hypothetical protein
MPDFANENPFILTQQSQVLAVGAVPEKGNSFSFGGMPMLDTCLSRNSFKQHNSVSHQALIVT